MAPHREKWKAYSIPSICDTTERAAPEKRDNHRHFEVQLPAEAPAEAPAEVQVQVQVEVGGGRKCKVRKGIEKTPQRRA